MSKTELEGKNTTNNVLTHKGTKVFHRRNKVKALLATISLIGGFGIGIGIGWGIFHPTSSTTPNVNITFGNYSASMDAPTGTPNTQIIKATASDRGAVTLSAAGPSGNNWSFANNILTYSTACDSKQTVTITAKEGSNTSSINIDLLPETSPTPIPAQLTKTGKVIDFFNLLDEKHQPTAGTAPTSKQLFWSTCYTCFGTLYRELYPNHQANEIDYDPGKLYDLGDNADSGVLLQFSDDYTHVKMSFDEYISSEYSGSCEIYYNDNSAVALKLVEGSGTSSESININLYPSEFKVINNGERPHTQQDENMDRDGNYDYSLFCLKESEDPSAPYLNDQPVELQWNVFGDLKLCYPYFYQYYGSDTHDTPHLLLNYFIIFCHTANIPWPFDSTQK